MTLVSLVPTMLSRLLDAGLQAPPTLRRVLLGGGPIAPALLARARAARVPVSPSYGMTEACSQIATDGIPLLGTELRIAADGEVLVRGRTVAAGALGPDGWLHTGDLGAFDDAGRLVIAGRKADTIVTGGENVAPVEVEAVLLEHPGVLDAAVFGRSDPEWGEAVVAQVVLADGAGVETEALRAHCAARLAPFKVPKRFEPVSGVPRGVHRQAAAPRAALTRQHVTSSDVTSIGGMHLDPVPADLTIEQLAAQTGMTVRNIRAHQARGLLEPPEVRLRVGYYGPGHVARLKLIHELQDDGFNLAGIKRLLEDDQATAQRLARFRQALSETASRRRRSPWRSWAGAFASAPRRRPRCWPGPRRWACSSPPARVATRSPAPRC